MSEIDDLRAQLADMAEQLAGACEAIDVCHEEYADMERACGDWSERCAQLEAQLAAAQTKLAASDASLTTMEERWLRLLNEKLAASRLVHTWQARCESREESLRECLRLAETGDCGAIAIAVEAALGEVAP